RRLLRDPAQEHIAGLGDRLSGPDACLRRDRAQPDRPAGRGDADHACNLSGPGARPVGRDQRGQPMAAPMSVAATTMFPDRQRAEHLRRFVRSCVSSPLNLTLTAVLLALALVALPAIARWAVLDAVWSGTSGKDCAGHDGACWIFLRARAEPL